MRKLIKCIYTYTTYITCNFYIYTLHFQKWKRLNFCLIYKTSPTPLVIKMGVRYLIQYTRLYNIFQKFQDFFFFTSSLFKPEKNRWTNSIKFRPFISLFDFCCSWKGLSRVTTYFSYTDLFKTRKSDIFYILKFLKHHTNFTYFSSHVQCKIPIDFLLIYMNMHRNTKQYTCVEGAVSKHNVRCINVGHFSF